MVLNIDISSSIMYAICVSIILVTYIIYRFKNEREE